MGQQVLSCCFTQNNDRSDFTSHWGVMQKPPCSTNVHPSIMERIHGDTTVAFMHRLRQKHPGKQLLILWDNVSYHYQGDMKEFLLYVNAFREPHAWVVTCMRFAPYASEQNPIEHVWQIGKQYVRALFHSLRTFSDIKGAFERIKDMRFTFEDLAMYMSTCQEYQQAI